MLWILVYLHQFLKFEKYDDDRFTPFPSRLWTFGETPTYARVLGKIFLRDPPGP